MWHGSHTGETILWGKTQVNLLIKIMSNNVKTVSNKLNNLIYNSCDTGGLGFLLTVPQTTHK